MPAWLRNTAILVGVVGLIAIVSWFLGNGQNAPLFAKSVVADNSTPQNASEVSTLETATEAEAPAVAPPAQSRWSVSLSNDQQLDMVLIQPSTYTRGSTPEQVGVAVQRFGLDADAGRRELPLHQVTITQPFFMGETEVTVGQFAAFVAATGYVTTAEKEGSAYIWRGDESSRSAGSWRAPGYPQTNEHPVVCVSWYDTQAFAEWLSTRTDQASFSLPTEAEFELALRSGNDSQFYWGDQSGGVEGRENVKDLSGRSLFGWQPSFPLDDGHPWPAPVRTYRPNPLGLYDMGGNVFEWCSDWYGTYLDQPQTDPQGPATGSERVYRGGGWRSALAAHRSAARWGYNLVNRSNTLGFRVVARQRFNEQASAP
jgi:formylglycine-generating enzyme required for sulfatase activity